MDNQQIKVILIGAAGRMGLEAVKAITHSESMSLVGATGHQSGLGEDIGKLAGISPLNISLTSDLQPLLEKYHQQTVVVDLSFGHCAHDHSKLALEYGCPIVIGATGLTSEQILELEALAQEHQKGILIAPNFSIGALVMMHLAQKANQYFESVEIIELHHDGKKDAPSGTAIKTAQLLERENIPIHSVRLPGLVANQAVMFGTTGQTLTIRHDTINREAFMPGLLLSIEKVLTLKKLVYGLESFLNF